MNEKKVLEAVQAAKEFLKRHKAMKDGTKTSDWGDGKTFEFTPPRLSGAFRRASLDLTMALADMRRPGN